MHKFKVGDKCRIKSNDDIKPEYRGVECVILSFKVPFPASLNNDCVVQCLNGAKGQWLEIKNLEPLNKPKQQETIAWDEACFDKSGKWVHEGVAA